jgi:hypothetical protein
MVMMLFKYRMDMGSVTDVSQVYNASIFRAGFGPIRTERKVAAGTRSTGQQ